MIDRSRPNFFFRRGTWAAAIVGSLALLVGLGLTLPSPRVLLLAGLPLAVVAVGFLAVLAAAIALGATLRYPLWKVSDCCPRCRRELPPAYRCPGCATLHDDLRPGPYGLWSAQCGSCGRTLATTDRGGRAAYPKVCGNPECRRELPAPAGTWPEYHIALVGRDARLLLPALHRFEDDFARPNRIALSFLDPDEEHAYRDGDPAAQSVRKLTVGLQQPDGNACLLYLTDLTTSGVTERYLALSRLDGLLFVIDPPTEGADWSAAPGPVYRRFALTVALLVPWRDDRPGLPSHDVLGTFVTIEAAAQESERPTAAVRQRLVGAGLGPLIEGVERRFDRVACFAEGAATQGLGTPLVWLLCRTGALTDGSPQGRVLAHLASHWRRWRRGDEGAGLEGCLLVVPPFALAAMCLWGVFGPWLVGLSLAGGAFALWWLWYERVRPRRDQA